MELVVRATAAGSLKVTVPQLRRLPGADKLPLLVVKGR
jgi:hypothetical protein